MAFTNIEVVIFGKTYPEPSRRYFETVCTGGIRTDTGAPVRLYPVQLRYLTGDQQYRLWERVVVPVDRNRRDQRPESWKIDARGIQRLGVVDTTDGWRARRELLELNRSWHYANMGALTAANRAANTSIGLVRPGSIERVELVEKPASERAEFDAKCAELRAQKESDLFDPEYKRLDFLPKEIVLRWRCDPLCETCSRNPHGMKVLDWGLLELARNRGWEAAASKLESIGDLAVHDFRLFLGNFAQHPRQFGVIALWYPKLQEQLAFL